MKALLALAFAATSLHAATQITWERKQLHGDFYSEGAAIGDINGDGKPDIVAGPFWWEGPAFEKKHAYYTPSIFSINGYSDNFFAYVYDFNGDQKNDILILGFPGKEARLYLNPGVHDDKPWPMSIVADVVDNESPVFTDVDGDGIPELVCSRDGFLGWYTSSPKPTEKWTFCSCSPRLGMGKFTHGLGVGDVNGDGKMDILDARHWWQQPAKMDMHDVPFTGGYMGYLFEQRDAPQGIAGGAQMFAYDFDGDGNNDIFTSLQAHRYGVAVYLQIKPAPTVKTSSGEVTLKTESQIDANGQAIPGTEVDVSTKWKRVMLASENPADNDYGIVFSQPHAAALADINGDGVKDIVVGKRYWAHNGHDPDERGARVVYWYETKRDGKGGVDFIPHLADANSGVGVDVTVGDVNGDGLPDIVSANKAGVFILTQKRTDTTAEVKPVKMYGPGLKPQTEYAHGQSPQDALKNLQLPTGFKADLIAAEPDIVQPIAFCFDERGRIWLLEGLSYPQPRKEGEGKDRIVILEDSDGDGTYETKKVFCEGINLGSGIEVGFGGVWVGAAPYLMFIPLKDDRPLLRTEGTERTKGTTTEKKSLQPFELVPGLPFTAYALLDGFGTQDTHETLNSFIWGPDGWLYGCHGVFTHSKIGKPGTPDEQRTPMNAGVWRYHPVRHVFEVFAHGTSNPWGLDYDENGEFFVTACVIPHLYHIVPGARYHRQGGQHFNPYTYEDIVTIADHAHYAGDIRNNAHWGGRDGGSIVQDDTNAAGGGHAHCGLAIYQSSQFPADYRNKLIFGNLHGHRLVTDYLDPHGSTYIGKHGSDFMRSNDLNFIPVTQKVGPDGSLYVSDWSDKQVCHRGSGAVEIWDRSNGRIYRVSYVGEGSADTPVRSPSHEDPRGNLPRGADKSVRAPFPTAPFDLAKESDETLAKLAVQTENEWFSRQARRVLMERVNDRQQKEIDWVKKWMAGHDAASWTHKPLTESKNPQEQLRALWLWNAIEYAPSGDLSSILDYADPSMRVWAVRLLSQKGRTWWLGAKVDDLANYFPLALALRTNDRGTPPPSKPGEIREAPTEREELFHLHEELRRVLAKEQSPAVRREYSSALQSLPLDCRTEIARALLSHGEDKDDPYIPLLIWYGIEPLVGADPKAALELAKVSKMPKVTEFIYRRMGAEEAGRTGLLTLAAETKDAAMRDTLLDTVLKSARAGNKISKPENWAALRANVVSTSVGTNNADAPTKVEATLTELEAFMGIEEAKQHFRSVLTSTQTSAAEKEQAVALLTAVRDIPTAALLIDVVGQVSTPVSSPAGVPPADGGLKTRRTGDRQNACPTRAAIQALAVLPHPRTAEVLTAVFTQLTPSEQQDAMNTLATTASGAKALLTAVKAKTIPSTMLSPFLARQLAALNNADVSALLKDTFGDLNAPKADLEERKKKFRALLTKGDLAAADKAKGKVLFSAICGQCHSMFGEGQKVGPDLTGSNRGNLDYLLDNVLDPNAVIGKDYQLNIFELNDGRVASGVVKEDSPSAVRIAMPGGLEQTITTSEIKKRTVSKVSTMPEGLFDALPVEQLRQLVAYLQTNASPDKGKGGPAIKVEGVIEAETMKVLSKTGGSTRPQGMGGFGNKWSGGSQLWWTGAKPTNVLTLAMPVAKAGKFAVKTVLTKAKDYGICDIALDGKGVLADFDGFNADKVVLTDELDLGTHDLTAGEHQLTFTIKGANPQAVKSYMVGIDYVKLEAK